MSWYTPDIKSVLGLSAIMSFYGVMSMVIYLLPPEYGVGLRYKLVMIGLILLTMPIVLLVGFFINRRSKKKAEKEKAEAEGQSAEATPQKTNKAEAPDDISQAAEEAVQFLKSSNLGSGKDAVYELPWYFVIGGPKTGKSSLALASALNFQTLPSQRQSEFKFIRPTRNVDWRVTSEAVFLDTAGRYQLEGGDEGEWSGLIETIKKYRPNRPLDGMIVTVNVERILNSDDNEIEQVAKVLRGRIDEVMQRTKIRFPVYLVFTHADSIEGFRDSFSNSQKEGKNLGWGATIPLEKSENAHTLFDAEFDLLQTSIMKRRLMRLSAPFPPVRQLKIFNFPLHFGSTRKKLGHFVNNLFRPNPFSESPFLRGFYFTAVPVNRGKVDGAQTLTNVGQTVGLSYFTERLFREVILRDKDLVATFQAQRVRPPIMGWLLTFFGAILSFLLLAGAGYSLYTNKVKVERASKRGEAVLTLMRNDKDKPPLTKNLEDTKFELDKIEQLRESLAELDRYEREGAPYLMRFGLYSGNRIYLEKLLPIYYNAIEQRFKKPVLRRLEDELRKFSSSNTTFNSTSLSPQEEDVLGKNYDLLKAYLMLSGQYQDKAEGTFLATTLADFWKTEGKVPEGYELIAQEQLNFYAKQSDKFDARSLADPSRIMPSHFPRINLDEANNKALVEATRKKLQAYPQIFRYYKRVITDITKKIGNDISTESVLGGRSEGVFVGSYTVPGAYTYDGYHKYFKEALDKTPEENDWVLGENPDKTQDQGVDRKRLEDKYLNDYTDNWRKFIRSVNVKRFEKKEDAVNALTSFSDTESPMRILLEEVSRQTNLSAVKPVTCCSLDYFLSFVTSPQKADEKNKTIVEKEFDPLFKFTAGDKEKSPLSQYGKDIKDVSDELKLKSPDEIKALSDELANNSKSKFVTILNQSEKAVNTKAEGFKGTSAGQEIAELLRRPLNNLKTFLGAGALDTITKMWNDQILPSARKAEKGYPFDNDGEAVIDEMNKYLAPGGTLSKFFDERLKQYFELVNGEWKVKDTSEVKNFDENFVKYLNSAFRLREALYGKNQTPSFSYELKLQKMNDAIIEVTIDGQPINSNGTGTTKLTFPAPSGETGVLMKFSSTAEPSSTSSSPPDSANSPSGNVNNSNSTAPASKPKPSSSDSSGSSSERSFAGTWGLFKFFDAGGGAANKNTNGEYVLTYKLRNQTVTATIKPLSGDLFDRNMFTSVRAPQNMLKPQNTPN